LKQTEAEFGAMAEKEGEHGHDRYGRTRTSTMVRYMRLDAVNLMVVARNPNEHRNVAGGELLWRRKDVNVGGAI
jgi:hypothetical protein